MAETAALPRRPDTLDRGPGYDQDFVLWAQHQAELMRAGRFELVDWENVAEEIEGLGVSDRRQLRNRLEVLTMHLLRWQFQPMHRSPGWQSSIRVQRSRIERLLRDSRSLRGEVAELSRLEYDSARRSASVATGLAPGTFPKVLPYGPDQLLDDDFFPDPIDET